MDNREVLRTALEQSARELNCRAEDFLRSENVVTPLALAAGARAYYEPQTACNLVSYGNNIVASTVEECRSAVEEYLARYEFYRCFETPGLHWLNSRLEAVGQRICFMAEYYLPDLDRLRALGCGYELRLLGQRDFEGLYRPEWSNALCEKRRQLDVMGMGAYDGGRLVGLAGCSADCACMWQIGVDVLPEYRRRGVAAALTSSLAVEILKQGRVPFYCSAWSNIRSVRNAVKSGFVPAWVELTAKPGGNVDKLDQSQVLKGTAV